MVLTLTCEGVSVVIKKEWIKRWEMLSDMVDDVGEGCLDWTYTSLPTLQLWVDLNGSELVTDHLLLYTRLSSIISFMRPTSNTWLLHLYLDCEDREVRMKCYDMLEKVLKKNKPEPYNSEIKKYEEVFHENLHFAKGGSPIIYNAYLLHKATEEYRNGVNWECVRWDDVATRCPAWDVDVTSEPNLSYSEAATFSCHLPYLLASLHPPKSKRIRIYTSFRSSEVTSEIIHLALSYAVKLCDDHLPELTEQLQLDEAFSGMLVLMPYKAPLLQLIGSLLAPLIHCRHPERSREAIRQRYGEEVLNMYKEIVKKASGLLHIRENLPKAMKVFCNE